MGHEMHECNGDRLVIGFRPSHDFIIVLLNALSHLAHMLGRSTPRECAPRASNRPDPADMFGKIEVLPCRPSSHAIDEAEKYKEKESL